MIRRLSGRQAWRSEVSRIPFPSRWTQFMESLRTMFRLVVMVIAIVIAYKGWQHYGPSVDSLKALAQRAVEMAQESLEDGDHPPASGAATLAADPGAAAPPFAPQPAVGGQVLPAQALVPADQFPEAALTPLAPPALAPAQTATIENPIATPPDVALDALYLRLEQLGVHKRQLSEWGGGGSHRFTCAAAVTDSPSFSRHFEAIAAEPRVAVQEVLAKVEAWRAAQRSDARIGTTLQ
jgi:hypothetical protein